MSTPSTGARTPEGRHTQRCDAACGRFFPLAFTEHGLAMFSSVLRSDRAVTVKIEIMRPFVRLRRFLLLHEKHARQVADLARKVDAQVRVVFDAIRNLMTPRETAPPPRRRIGLAEQEGE